MAFRDLILGRPRPASVRAIDLPRRERFFPSPADWRDEVIYFLLPDRFSDGARGRAPAARSPPAPPARPRRGVPLRRLGAERARALPGRHHHRASSRSSTISDARRHHAVGRTGLQAAGAPRHVSRLRHPGLPRGRSALRHARRTWSRSSMPRTPRACASSSTSSSTTPAATGSTPTASASRRSCRLPAFHAKGDWFDGNGDTASVARRRRTWTPACGRASCRPRTTTPARAAWTSAAISTTSTRRSAAPISSTFATSTSTAPTRSTDLARCYKYWIALTDCDGFRLDTLKHVPAEAGRNFCGTIKEFAANLGKADFFLVGEVAGSDADAAKYRHVLGQNLNATLDIGEMRRALHAVAKGLARADARISISSACWDDDLGSHRELGARHVSVLDDHDHVSGDKLRFSTDAALRSSGGGGRGPAALLARHPVHLLRHASRRSPGRRRRARRVPARLHARHRHRRLSCARRCSGRRTRARRAGPASATRRRRRDRTRRPGSDRSAPRGSTASIPRRRPTGASRR